MRSISIKQNNNIINYINKKNTANSNKKDNNTLKEAKNLLKGYVNNLVKQTVLEFNVEERRSFLLKRNKYGYGGSSSNLRVKRKRGMLRKKENDDKEFKRRMSYNIDNNNRYQFEVYKKDNELLDKKEQIILDKNVKFEKKKSESDENLTDEKSSSRVFQRKKNNFKTQKIEKFSDNIPKSPKKRLKTYEKAKSNSNSNNQFQTEIKGSPELESKNINQKKTNKEESKELFSFLKKPQIFEGDSELKENLGFNNEDDILHFSGLSNKNILQLNEIKKELHKTLIGKKQSIEEKLSLKSYLNDDNFQNENNASNINNISNIIDKEKYRILTRKGYVYDSYDDEENFDEKDIHSHFVPESFFIIIFDFFVAICVLYNLISIPLFLGHNRIYCLSDNYFTFQNIIDNIIDFIFILDIFINFFTAYYNFDEVLIIDSKSIYKNYLKTWFFFDLLSAIPIKTIIILYNKDCYHSDITTQLYNGNYYYLFLLLRLIKTFQVISKNQFLIVLENELSKFDNYNSYGRLLITLIIFFISLHIVACILIFLGKNEYPNWIINFGHNDKTFSQMYLIGIYYTITTVTTVGYGDLSCVTTIEKIFGLFMEIVGIIAYSWALTAMSNYVKIENDKQIDFKNKCQILSEIKLSYPHLPDDLYERIIRFLRYKHNSEQKDNHIIFDELPIALRNTLLYEMYKPIINSFNFFKNFTNSDFIIKVILAFKPILALKNDILIKDGDFVEDIIFVKRGRLSLELPIDFNPPKQKRSVRRDSLLGIRKTTIFFNNLQRENSVSPNLKTKIFNSPTKKNLKSPMNILKTLTKSLTKMQTKNENENIQNFKVLEIRKNEHFGDILMFLNQRSPLLLKVKSNKAELFFLNKSEAIAISTSYPQYWKRINKKSLFNMEQIKRLTNKIIRIISSSHGIAKPKKKNILKTSSLLSNNNFEFVPEDDSDLKTIPSISEESNIDNTLFKTNFYTSEDEEEKENNENNSDIDNDNDNDDDDNNKMNKRGKIRNMNQSLNTILEDEGYSSSSQSSYSSFSTSLKKEKSEKSEKTEKTEKNIQLQTINSEDISSEKNSSSSPSEESGFEKKIKSKSKKSENSCDDIIRKKESIEVSITPYNKEEINNEIYPEEIFITTGGTNTNYIINNNILHPIISDNISVCSTEISFSINSEYENIDELSDHVYSKDHKLRKKVKKYIKDLINFKNQTFMTKSSIGSGIKNNFSISKNYHHMKNPYRKIPSENYKNPTIKHFGSGNGFNIQKTKTINHGNFSTDHLKTNYTRNNSGKIGNNHINNILNYEENEKLIINNNNNNNNKSSKILDVIGHNIEKNVMNLNNPEQFYSEFFLKFMNKKKGNNSSIEIKKEEQDFINKIERKATVREKGFKNIKSKI